MKFVDLFAGLGGFHLGLSKLGHECVFASELNPYLRELYEVNHGIKPVGDITAVNVDDIPDHDILCGGFPCQSFSNCGNKQGFDDARGTLIWNVCEILQHKQPRFFILENVWNLLTHDNGQTWDVIYRILSDCGYSIDYNIYSPVDFGIPHNRNRIFIVGDRDASHLKVNWHAPTHKKSDCDAKSILDNEEYGTVGDIQKKYIEAWDNYISGLDVVPNYIENPDDDVIKGFPRTRRMFGTTNGYTDIKNAIIQFRASGIRIYPPKVYPCMTHLNWDVVIGWEMRRLTIMEMARLQSMEGLKVLPKTNEIAKASFGNAVNVKCVEMVADSLLNRRCNLFE